jgi:hypothetical protein
MQFSSFLFATLALAVSSVWAQDATSDDSSTCLRICRDEPIKCQAGWEPTNLGGEGDDVCLHSSYPLG